jgi:hypothetical protein
MIPAALSTMLQQGVADFLRMSFWSSTPGMEDVIERFVQTEGATFKGPFVSVKLPFRQGSDRELFPARPARLPRASSPGASRGRLSGAIAEEHPRRDRDGLGQDGVVPHADSRSLPAQRRHAGGEGDPHLPDERARHRSGAAHRRALLEDPVARRGSCGPLHRREGKRRRSRASLMGDDHIITDRARMQRDPAGHPPHQLQDARLPPRPTRGPGDVGTQQAPHPCATSSSTSSTASTERRGRTSRA